MSAVLQQPAETWMIIPNYSFGWDNGCPKFEVDLRVWYARPRFGDRHAYVSRIECDNSRTSKPVWEPCQLPECVVDDLEREINHELRYDELGDEE